MPLHFRNLLMEDIIHMGNKFENMHADILKACDEMGIHLIPGRVVYQESLTKDIFKAPKVFFALEDEYAGLDEKLEKALSKEIYEVKKAKEISIRRLDIFAGNYSDIIENPEEKSSPEFKIRSISRVDEDSYSTVVNGKKVSIPAAFMDDLKPYEGHKAGKLYMPENREDFIAALYGKSTKKKKTIPEYEVFDDVVEPAILLKAIKDAGCVSSERVKKEKEYQKWTKEVAKPITSRYRKYQKMLLSMTLDD